MHLRRGPTSHRRRRWTVVIALCALLLPLLGLEVGIRGLIAIGWVTNAPSRDLEMDLGLLARAAEPRQDVLLLGDSVTRRGVDPTVLAQLIEQGIGRPAGVVSMAQLDVDFRSMWLLARQLGEEGRLPRVMLVGISMGSYGGPRAEPGARAIERSPMGRLLVGCGGEELPVGWLECQLGQVSSAWQWRGQPARLLDELTAAATRGDTPTGQGTVRRDGFEATPGTTRQRLDMLLATRYLGQIVDITPTRLATASAGIHDLVAYLEGEGVAVVLFTVPYPPPLLDSIRSRFPGLAAQDAAALDVLAATAGRPILRTGAMGDWWTPDESSDLKHLSTAGAEAFTRQLWATAAFRDQIVAALGRVPVSVQGALGDGAGRGTRTPTRSP